MRSSLVSVLQALAVVVLTLATVIYPEVAFHSSREGLELWWTIVFPALLPFFVLSQMLMGLGVVHFLGVLLEPMMRPAFRVPGAGSFVMAMGLASGYPIGAVLTARLREQGLVSRVEGERLMAFTNTADPLFMTGAVAVGMFNRPEVAGIIMAAHYLGALATGVLMRFHGPAAKASGAPPLPPETALRRAVLALREARRADGRPLGQLMGDCIRDSVNTLLLIGGFIIVFMVVIRVLAAVGVAGVLSQGVASALALLGVHPGTASALVNGFFEITIGCQTASQAAAPLVQQLMAAGGIIAWSGLSVHAQVAALTRYTDLRLRPYVLARFAHALLSAGFTLLLGEVIGFAGTAPVLAPARGVISTLGSSSRLVGQTMGLLALAAVAALVIDVLAKIRVVGFRTP
jgi:sporulation integral membrane protein YlbJ